MAFIQEENQKHPSFFFLAHFVSNKLKYVFNHL